MVVGLLCWLAAIGSTAVAGILVTAVVLVVLIGAGNLLSPHPPHRRAPIASGIGGEGGEQDEHERRP